MHDKNNNVTKLDLEVVMVTPQQKELLEFLSPIDVVEYAKMLKEVHKIALYFSEDELSKEDRTACFYVNLLLEHIQAIANNPSPIN